MSCTIQTCSKRAVRLAEWSLWAEPDVALFRMRFLTFRLTFETFACHPDGLLSKLDRICVKKGAAIRNERPEISLGEHFGFVTPCFGDMGRPRSTDNPSASLYFVFGITLRWTVVSDTRQHPLAPTNFCYTVGSKRKNGFRKRQVGNGGRRAATCVPSPRRLRPAQRSGSGAAPTPAPSPSGGSSYSY